MDSNQHFMINTRRIAYQTFDNEIVIIDFESGSYFCIDQVGAFIWSKIESRFSLEEIVTAVKAGFSADGKDIKAIVTKFLHLLIDESLIMPIEKASIPEYMKEIDRKSIISQNQSDFQDPLLHKFTDMQELLLLDPIHDVQDDGWPGKLTE